MFNMTLSYTSSVPSERVTIKGGPKTFRWTLSHHLNHGVHLWPRGPQLKFTTKNCTKKGGCEKKGDKEKLRGENEPKKEKGGLV